MGAHRTGPDPRDIVLVVDDDLMVLHAVSTVLEAGGYHVVSTTSAAEATRLAADEHPDLVLTDIQLPGMDGIELTRVIHRDMPEIPIVVMTGMPLDVHTERARTAGAVRVLAKPIDASLLLSTLAEEIASHRAPSPSLRR